VKGVDAPIGEPLYFSCVLSLSLTPFIFSHFHSNLHYKLSGKISKTLNWQKDFFYEILVEREGNAFYVEVHYDRLPDFCYHCQIIGHSVGN